MFSVQLKKMLLLVVNHLLQEQYENLAVIHYSMLESAKRDGDSSSVMMKLGALEYRVGRLEESVSGRQKELSDQKEKAICLENENKHLASKVATLERAVSTKQENLNALKSKYDDIKHSLKCLICNNAKLPSVVSSGCKIVIGCQQCAQRWLDENDTCPHCRASLSLDTCTIIPKIRSLEGAFDEGTESNIIID